MIAVRLWTFGSLSRMRRWGLGTRVGWAGTLGAVLFGLWVGMASAQTPAPRAGVADREMEAAEALVGKALFLRGFYLTNDLSYDTAGRVLGSPKIGDWTLAAVNVLKVERRGTGEIELDGVRVAIRYNADAHEFQRHALNDEKMRVVVKDSGDAKQLEGAFAAIFAVGIDSGLQRAMPDYWRHYFDPSLAWPQDALSGQTIYAMNGAADQIKDVTAPRVEHRVEAKYSEFAIRDKVQGTLQLRLVVDADGVPLRIAVSRPLGYGLDASAVEAMMKWRFAPGVKDGSAVATGMVVEQQFSLTNAPR
jgi:TonB family protein